MVIKNVICDNRTETYSHDSYSDNKFPIVIVTFVKVPAGNYKRDMLKEKVNEGTAESETKLMNL